MTITNFEVDLCSYQKWYPQFVNVTTESFVVCIPEEVVSYLRADKLVLPKEAIFKRETTSTDDSDWDDSDDDTSELTQPSFPEFSKQLKDAINQLGGSVFIKLNWSAPTDAAWITTCKTLKCTNLEDVFLLLKSSTRIAKDLAHTFKPTGSNDVNFCLVLKQWQDIHPGSEFRCFVIDNKLVGICQRDFTTYYDFINNSKYEIVEDIKKFYNEYILNRFSLTSYIFDVIRISSNSVSIVDFSPYNQNPKTSSGLFSWTDLDELSVRDCDDGPEFRFLGEEPGYQPNYHGVPYEFAGLCERQSQLSLMDYVRSEVETQGHNSENNPESDEEVQQGP